MIHRAASRLHEAVERLEGFEDSRKQLVALRELEDEGDRLSREAIAELFRSGADPLTIIRWKDIHEQLEEAVDACENAADVLEAILVKNRTVTLLVVTVVVALAFDFTNGFHDTANAVATSVSTRALSPRLAVADRRDREPRRRVRHDRGRDDGRQGDHRHRPRDRADRARRRARRDRLEPAHVVARPAVVVVARADRRPRSAPRSRSRATSGVEWHGVVHKVVIPALWAPTIAFAGAFLLLLAIYWVFQWMTPGRRQPVVPARAARHRHLGRVHARRERRAEDDGRDRARALRERLDRHLLHPDLGQDRRRPRDRRRAPTPAAGGSCARSASASSRWIRRPASPRRRRRAPSSTPRRSYGYPLSTTHVVSGAVMGAGATKRLSAVRWGVAGNIVFAWILTIPAVGRSSPRSSGGRSQWIFGMRLGVGAGSGVIYVLLAQAGEARARGRAGRRAALPSSGRPGRSQDEVKELEHDGRQHRLASCSARRTRCS